MEHSLEEGNLPEELLKCPPSPSNPSGTKRLCIVGTLQPKDGHLLENMDVPAVEATRSYWKWLALLKGASFIYNQTYIRGKLTPTGCSVRIFWDECATNMKMESRLQNRRMDPADLVLANGLLRTTNLNHRVRLGAKSAFRWTSKLSIFFRIPLTFVTPEALDRCSIMLFQLYARDWG